MQFGIAPDPGIDRPGRLHRALEALRRARVDADQEEQNPDALGLRLRATRDIDIAINHDKRAIRDLERASI